MPEPRAKTLRVLLARYAEARITQAHSRARDVSGEIDAIVQALCAATSTTCVQDAIVAADLILSQPERAAAGKQRTGIAA
ncbi:DUF5133 domain-containing protein [Streptomyces sp. NPDC048111]|uniref:DUF5133 domain-containing protein n=1 Tax=Streptomyces sp. NPDC048111 TaxID=3365500 RepID=UPI003712623F